MAHLLQQQKDQSVNDAGADAEYDHGPRDDEHLCGCAGDIAFALEFQRRRNHRVGKSRDGPKGACAGEFG